MKRNPNAPVTKAGWLFKQVGHPTLLPLSPSLAPLSMVAVLSHLFLSCL